MFTCLFYLTKSPKPKDIQFIIIEDQQIYCNQWIWGFKKLLKQLTNYLNYC